MSTYQSVYGSVMSQIGPARYMELREHIISRTPVQVSKKELVLAYSLGEQFFQRALEDMSLMPVNSSCILRCMERNGWTVEDIWEEYNKDRGGRVESIVLCSNRCS